MPIYSFFIFFILENHQTSHITVREYVFSSGRTIVFRFNEYLSLSGGFGSGVGKVSQFPLVWSLPGSIDNSPEPSPGINYRLEQWSGRVFRFYGTYFRNRGLARKHGKTQYNPAKLNERRLDMSAAMQGGARHVKKL